VFKTFIKAKLLLDKKIIRADEFNQVEAPLRKAFDTLSYLYDFYGEDSTKINQTLLPKFQEASKRLFEVRDFLKRILEPHVQEKSVNRLSSIFDFLGSSQFLQRIWNNPDINEELLDLMMVIKRYTQFE